MPSLNFFFPIQFADEGANMLVCTPGRMEDILTGEHEEEENANRMKKGLKALV